MRKKNFMSIALLNDLYARDLLDMDPPYQRRSVWNQSFKDYFIDTILLGYPSPALFLYEEISPEGSMTYSVVDGKQRLATVFDFIRGEFPVADTAKRESLRGRPFADLGDEERARFFSYQFLVEHIATTDEAVINDIFDRINRNTARLSPQELRHARYGGVFINSMETLSSWLFDRLPKGFPNIAPQSRRQMKDVELVAQLALALEEGPRGYSRDNLDKAFSDRDDSWEEEEDVETRFRATSDTLGDLLNEAEDLTGTSLRNQADFYSLFGAIAAALEQGEAPDYGLWSTQLRALVSLAETEEGRASSEKVGEYYEAARADSNSTRPRQARIRIVKGLLQGELELT